jgi:hypothetical protein
MFCVNRSKKSYDFMTKQPDILFIKIREEMWYGNVDKVVPVPPGFKIPVVAGHFHNRHYWELLAIS